MTIEIFALALIAIACLVVWGCFFVMLWQRRPENPKPNPKSGASRPPCGEQDGEGDELNVLNPDGTITREPLDGPQGEEL